MLDVVLRELLMRPGRRLLAALRQLIVTAIILESIRVLLRADEKGRRAGTVQNRAVG